METYKLKEQLSLEDTVLSIQAGNEGLQDKLLKAYQPFIAKAVSEVCNRYIDPKTDDEFSIGLFAFNEAFFLYAPGKGSSFLSFAKLIIKRKVIDYIRYQSKRQNTLSFDQFYDEESMENLAEVAVVIDQYRAKQDSVYLKEETIDYKEKLSEYNLCLLELAEVSPKHRDARENIVKIARTLREDEELREFVLTKKKLPIKKLEKKVEFSKKTIERNRKYILAIFIVLNENYVYLQDYLKEVGL